MAIVAHLVEKVGAGSVVANQQEQDVHDGIRAVVIAIDNAVDTTDALVQARAVTVLNANGFSLPTGYFNANRGLAATFDAAGDFAVWGLRGEKLGEVVA